jgi:dihydrofolate synthase/folylpolyglutamate synthase
VLFSVDIDSLLQPFERFGVHLGLERIFQLLANLDNPHDQVPIIHVAGSNGKGSVCAYLSSILTEAGYRTGRYTSPHLVNWTERICLNEQQILAEELCQLLLKVQGAINPNDESPTQFEIITAAAWLYFAQQKVDVAVIEVGLGGRLDATNVCSQPLVSIITSISREHWQILGSTIADIAKEKAGILKPRCPAVIGPLPPDAEKVVLARAVELECPYVMPQTARQVAPGWAEYVFNDTSITADECRSTQIEEKNIGVHPRLSAVSKSIKYLLPLSGQIQLTNSALAMAAIEILQKQSWQISEAAIVNGMAKTQWPGRIQWVSWKNYKLLVDGAHNPGSAEVLRDYVDTLNYLNVSWVMGMLSTKDHENVFKALLRENDQLYLVPVPNQMSASPSELAQLAQSICPNINCCQTYLDLLSALEAALTSTDNLVVLCGSLYLVGHFFSLIR